jgi:hypothetical protein
VLALLEVQNFETADAGEGVKLCAAAAQRGDIKLLEWLRNHDCPCDAATCSTAAVNGRLDVLMWAYKTGFPWDEGTCWCAARGGHLHVYCSGRVSTGVPGAKTRAAKQQLQVIWAKANGCPWDLYTVLLKAAACGSIDMLVWLQLSSGRPWTAAEMSEMLYETGHGIT